MKNVNVLVNYNSILLGDTPMKLEKVESYSAAIPAVISLIERTYSKDRKLARNEGPFHCE